MSIPPITFIGVNLGPEVGTDDTVVGVRVVPFRREGRTVYGRTLNSGNVTTRGHTGLAIPYLPILAPGSVKVMLADFGTAKPDRLTGTGQLVELDLFPI